MREQKFLQDLEKKLWTSANKLLPLLDAAVYKHVVLGMVLVKYVSDSFETRRQELKVAFADPLNEYFLAVPKKRSEKNMTETERLELEFYKNGSAESVLKRFVFSEKEEKLVRDAIRTAQRANPRMVLKHQADELLKEVAKTRQPIKPTETTSLSPEAMVQIQMASFKRADVKKDDKGIPFFYIPKTKLGRVIFFVMML